MGRGIIVLHEYVESTGLNSNSFSQVSVAVVPSLPQELEQEDSFDSFDSD